MGQIGLQQIAILLVIVLIIFRTRRWSGMGSLGEDWPRLSHELKRHLPVYSAETVQGKEAEFIRDRLPRRFPTALVLLAVLLLGAAAVWLSR
jgi:Sec-independent protein translocase protein TatA